MREKELVCIGCPLGCSLKVTIQDDSAMEVTGNTCPRGADYARKELTDPRRIVTSSVPVEGGHLPMCICEDRIRYTKKTRYLTVSKH